MKVGNPIEELLAIKLYEHDFDIWPKGQVSWSSLPEIEREEYRKCARGEDDYGIEILEWNGKGN